LRYPDDVESFIAAWFSGRPGWAADLKAQLRQRPALQQAATVPLILAFYCIVGGDQPLPARTAVRPLNINSPQKPRPMIRLPVNL
jgi:hypothetical protein